MAKRIFLKKRCTYKCIYMNSARLKNVKFPVFIVSPLEIRRYIGVTKLQKRKIFLFLRSKSFCRSFFCAGKREIGHQANAYD